MSEICDRWSDIVDDDDYRWWLWKWSYKSDDGDDNVNDDYD